MKPTASNSVRKRTRTKKAAFLRAISENCSVTSSSRLAGIDRTTHYEWLAQDSKYKEGFDIATQMGKDAMLDDLVRRGRIGVFTPYVYQGDFCYEPRKRVLCRLADGTTAFEDELPEDASVIQRRTVTVRGEKLGFYKRDQRALRKAVVEYRKVTGQPE